MSYSSNLTSEATSLSDIAKSVTDKVTEWYHKIVPGDQQEDKKEKSQESNAVTKAFQQYLSSSLPLVGKLYSGPTDGIYNSQIEDAAKKLEAQIGSYINKSLAGKIFSPSRKSFNTSVEDIKEAILLIQKHNPKQANT